MIYSCSMLILAIKARRNPAYDVDHVLVLMLAIIMFSF